MKMKIVPRFNAKEIIDSTIRKDWFQFEQHAFATGNTLLKYMKSYINNNHKRSGAKGKLAGAINLDILSTVGQIHWGIGHILTLNSRVKSWYVVNYGKKVGGQPFVPGGGKYRPVMFEDGPADSSKRGRGTSRATKFRKIQGGEAIPNVIRPMHYIEATYKMLRKHANLILLRLKGF